MAAFFCGAVRLSHVDDGDPCTPSTAWGSRRKHGGCRDNPYSTRGLDKFSTVLADLEARREKIMAEVAASSSRPGVYIIRFVYSSSDDWVPVVLKTHEQRPPEEKPRKGRGGGEAQKKQQAAAPAPAPTAELQPFGGVAAAAQDRAVKKSLSWKAGEGDGGRAWSSFARRPSRYVSVAALLILFCMAVYGRAFAICCASMWWYAVPAMKGGGGHGVTRPVRKEYGKKMNNKRLGTAAAAAGGQAAVARMAGGGSDGLVATRRHKTTV